MAEDTDMIAYSTRMSRNGRFPTLLQWIISRGDMH
jgi:hypothetical protein